MHTDYVSMGGKKIFTPFFLPYIRSTLEVHFFDFILGRATPVHFFFFCFTFFFPPARSDFWEAQGQETKEKV